MLINSRCLWYAYEKTSTSLRFRDALLQLGPLLFSALLSGIFRKEPSWKSLTLRLLGTQWPPFQGIWFEHVSACLIRTPHIPISPNASCISRCQHNMFRLRMYKTCQHSFEVQPQVGLAKPYRPPPRPTSGQPTFDHLSKGKLLNICPRQSHNLGIPPYPVSCPWTWGWKRQTNKQTNKVANRSQDTPTKNMFQLRQTNATFDGRNPAITSWYGKYMVNIPLFTGFHICQMVQDFFHQ